MTALLILPALLALSILSDAVFMSLSKTSAANTRRRAATVTSSAVASLVTTVLAGLYTVVLAQHGAVLVAAMFGYAALVSLGLTVIKFGALVHEISYTAPVPTGAGK